MVMRSDEIVDGGDWICEGGQVDDSDEFGKGAHVHVERGGSRTPTYFGRPLIPFQTKKLVGSGI
jgi:hypothetical protein